MGESRLLALVYRPSASNSPLAGMMFFRLALSEGPCDVTELSELLEKEGLSLVDVGTPEHLDKVERAFRMVKDVQES